MRFGFIFLVVAVCPNFLFSQSIFQSWNEVQIIVPVIQREDAKGKKVNHVTAAFYGDLRTSHTSHPEDRRLGLAMEFRLNKHFSLFSGVVYRKDEVVKYSPHIETRLDLGGVIYTSWRKFSIRDRNLYEHRYRNGRVNVDLYRQRFQISHPVTREGKTLFSPFISEEVYYDLGNRAWVQSEFYAGIARAFNKSTVLEIAYLRNDSKPVNINGISLTLKITVR